MPTINMKALAVAIATVVTIVLIVATYALWWQSIFFWLLLFIGVMVYWAVDGNPSANKHDSLEEEYKDVTGPW